MSRFRKASSRAQGLPRLAVRTARAVIISALLGAAAWGNAPPVWAGSATISGSIYRGAHNWTGTVFAPNPATPPINDARVMVQNQHSGGAFIAYPTVTGNQWSATVPAPGDYVVMFSAPGHDSTSREFTVADGDQQVKDAYLPPLPLPTANLLVYAFYDRVVNGEDDAPDDPWLAGVTFRVSDEHGNLLATGVTDLGGYYYFTGLPPGEVIVTSDASTVYLANNPYFSFDSSTEFYLTTSEEGGPAWDPKLYPGDPGTEEGSYMIWHGYVEKLGQLPPSPNAGSISGTLIDADAANLDVDEPWPVPGEDHPGVSLNEVVPDGFIVLYTDDETIPPHPVATTEADPVTGEFTLDNVPPGSYKMFISDIPIDYVWLQQQVTIAPNQHITGMTPLVPRFFARVQGYVLDNSTVPPTPISGATVNLRYKSGSIKDSRITDAEGWYNFDDAPEVEILGGVDVELPAGYRGSVVTERFYPTGRGADPGNPDPDCAEPGVTCLDVSHNAMNRYVQWYTANYRADLLVEPIVGGEGDVAGFVFYDNLATGTWAGDGVYEPGEERTMHGVTVELWDRATPATLVASTTTGEFDKAATLAQGWHEPYTMPVDEFGGVYAGPLPGYFEFRGLAPGDYTVKVIAPDGFSASPPATDTVTVSVAGGARADVDFGITTLVPLAGEIEGGVYDDLNVDANPLSLLFAEKAGITGAPVGVYDHLGYFMGAGYMGSTLCYMDHSTTPPTPSTVCPPGEDPIQKPEVERRFAAGVHIYVGNDPTLPGYNENYLPLVLAYDFGQGQYKFEADWSLIPVAWKGQRGAMLEREDVLRPYRPVIFGVIPAGSYVITGENFGDIRGHSTVTLSGTELFVKSWSDTEIHVEDPQVPISGPLVVTTLEGPSNAVHVDTGYYPPQSVFVDANSSGAEDGSLTNPWKTISQALDNLPGVVPRYVFVAPGSYNELVQIKESDIHIIGAGPVETTIDGRVATPISTQGPSNGGGPVIFIGQGGETGGVENVMISGFTITGGSVNSDEIGAGIFADYGNRNIDINNCVIAHNGGYYGGGIWMHLSNHDVRIWSNTIASNGNFGGYGGGISVNDEPEYGPEHGEPEHVWDDHDPGPPPGTYEIFNNIVFHNFSPDYGGGITLYEVKDHLRIFGNLIEENKADDHGGGAFFEDTGPIDIFDNTFLRNYCRDDGGAISFEDVGDDISVVQIYNNLFAENIADDCGENHARGGALAFDDTFYARVFNNTIVGNIVAGSYNPAGGGIDSERHGHEYNGGDPLGRYVAPGYSDPMIYNNIIWGNMRLHYEQPNEGEEEDLCYEWGLNYVWVPDNLHVDNPALQPSWESYNNSESLSYVTYNDIANGEYAGGVGNMSVDPQFVDPAALDWRLSAGSPVIDQAPADSSLTTDLDRFIRQSGDGWIDMGAYEPAGIALEIGRMSPPCGNAIVDSGEDCDDGNPFNSDGCLDDCSLAACGDGFLLAGVEECDDGNSSSGDGCDAACVAEFCGDGLLNDAPNEECDEGAANADLLPDRCRTDCSLPACGDAVADTGEECDDGNADHTDACTNGCLLAFCGDGYVRVGVEACDDANLSNTDGCLSDCRAAYCGDGFVRSGVEQCDDGNTDDGDGCSGVCATEFCGDGIVNNLIEQCDNAGPCCDTDCTIKAGACDDGNPCTSGDVCAAGECGGVAVDCSAMDNQCQLGLCDALSGLCQAQPLVDCSYLDGAGVLGLCDTLTGACEAHPCASVMLLANSALPATGGAFDVDVLIDVGALPLGGHEFVLGWDASALQLASVAGGGSVGFEAAPACTIDNVAGTATCAAFQAVSFVSPTGLVHIATLNMTVSLADNPDAESIAISVDSLYDAAGDPILLCADTQLLTIDVAPGDVTGDGYVNIVDALVSAQYQVGIRDCSSLERFDLCDINPVPSDGACTIVDAMWMAQCSVHLISCEFSCDPLNCSLPPGGALTIGRGLDAPEDLPAVAVVSSELPAGVFAKGDIITAEIVVETQSPLGAYSLGVECDESRLEIVAPVRGGDSPEFGQAPLQNLSGCHADLAGFQISSLDSPKGSVSVARVDLKVIGDTVTDPSSMFRVVSSVLVDTAGRPLDREFGLCPATGEGASALVSAKVRASLGAGNRSDRLTIRAVSSLAGLRNPPGKSALKIVVLDSDGTPIYSVALPASAFVNADGKGHRFAFKDRSGRQAKGLVAASIKILAKRKAARLKAKVRSADIPLAASRRSLALRLVFGEGAEADCLAGAGLACRGGGRRLHCRTR